MSVKIALFSRLPTGEVSVTVKAPKSAPPSLQDTLVSTRDLSVSQQVRENESKGLRSKLATYWQKPATIDGYKETLLALAERIPLLDDGHQTEETSKSKRLAKAGRGIINRAVSVTAGTRIEIGFGSFVPKMGMRVSLFENRAPAAPALPTEMGKRTTGLHSRSAVLATEHKKAFDMVLQNIRPRHHQNAGTRLAGILFEGHTLQLHHPESVSDSKDSLDQSDTESAVSLHSPEASELKRRLEVAQVWQPLMQNVGALKPTRQQYLLKMFGAVFSDVADQEQKQALITKHMPAILALAASLPALAVTGLPDNANQPGTLKQAISMLSGFAESMFATEMNAVYTQLNVSLSGPGLTPDLAIYHDIQFFSGQLLQSAASAKDAAYFG